MSAVLLRAIMLACCLAVSMAIVSPAAQAAYPDRPIRLIVPFGAGGGSDVAARLLGKQLSERLGTPFVIENITGAGGSIGMDRVARANPDGYTLAYIGGAATINPHFQKNIGFDVSKDFSPIGLYITSPIWVLSTPALPLKSLSELFEYARAHPGKISYATPGVGTPHHLAAELLKTRLNLEMVHVPYKGAGGAAAAAVGEQVQLLLSTPPAVKEFVANGRLTLIGSMDKKRSETEPELATVSEFVPDFEAAAWQGLVAPAGTDKAIIKTLSDALRETLADPEFTKQLLAIGFHPAYSTPAELQERIDRELKLWGDVIQKAGLAKE